jgi:hypothetical protein
MKYDDEFRSVLSNIFPLALILSLYACSGGTNAELSTETVQLTQHSATSSIPDGRLDVPTPNELLPHTRWIEVSLQEHILRLHDGEQIIAQYPVATGVGTSPEYTTYPGVFELNRMYRGPVETASGVFVTDVLEFDPAHGNGIHSLPKDKDGNILDERVGVSLTAGCIRVAEAATVFDFATLGMKIWVH